MRFTKILAVATALTLAGAPATAAPNPAPDVNTNIVALLPATLTIGAIQQAQPPQAEIKVDIDDDADTVWYADPVWLAVGALALLVVIVLAVMAARGGSDRGSTTVVR